MSRIVKTGGPVAGKNRQYYEKQGYGLKAPEAYEKFFVPVIGRPLAEDLVRLANLQPGEKVLDVACGTGIVARLASAVTGGSGRQVTGLDLNPGMLAVARTIPVDGTARWHEGNAEQMPFADGSFDVVFCQLGLQFMENRIEALREMNRVLAPGGRMLLNVPGPAEGVFRVFAETMEQIAGPEAASFVDHVFSLHEIPAIRLLMHEAGFVDPDLREQEKVLHLPKPKEFLWQYVHSTPLAALVSENEPLRKRLEEEIVSRWAEYVKGDGMEYRQRIVTARAWSLQKQN